ncbi:5-bromo-4-chloroindolyl phosphate hydrolysis family protein [Mobiluncus mulieris]|uniref:5-bromo-4-chloroindolyl phosphate hydrolysis protein n=1 Tax=Mobiluncus mulieris TaxID=2052 RepID=A0A7Y0YHT1_9ACTO|nr:5-bromo-4-chloroindolyl phosphate hydrolysis family protein [Mobiluncus mulieris]NMX03405.1 hypothetical protein [Mobiluncus mulieris]
MSFLFALLAAVLFAVLCAGFKVAWWVSLGVSVVAFAVLRFMRSQRKKRRKLVLDEAALNQRLKDIEVSARRSVLEIQKNAFRMRGFRKEASRLAKLSKQILNYVKTDSAALSKSEHFLEYYFPMLAKTMANYTLLSKAELEPEKHALIEKSTKESLDYLEAIFQKQLAAYHNNQILELEAQSELLEKTVKLGGEL